MTPIKVPAYAIIDSAHQLISGICEFGHCDVFPTAKAAALASNGADGIRIVPCEVTYEIPRKLYD